MVMASLQLNTFDVVGNREGLTDTIADLFADETPLFSMARKVAATSVLHEWQEDSLAAASKTGIVEGASVTYAQPATRTRLKNPTQIRLRNWDVTFTQAAVSKAGIRDDVARELTKLNPQNHVHVTELYAAVNLLRRVPPGPIMALLASRPWFVHVGNHFPVNLLFDPEDTGIHI